MDYFLIITPYIFLLTNYGLTFPCINNTPRLTTTVTKVLYCIYIVDNRGSDAHVTGSCIYHEII